MTVDLDTARARFPHLGFGVYAYRPEGGVLLEIHMPGGGTHEVRRPTLRDCLAAAFPELEEPETKTPDPFG